MARTQHLSILVLIGLGLVGCSTPRVYSGSNRRAQPPPPRAVPESKCNVGASLSIAIRGRINSKDHDDNRQVWLLHERIVPEKQQSQRTGFGEQEEGWKEISWTQAARAGVRRSSQTVWLLHSPNRWVPVSVKVHQK